MNRCHPSLEPREVQWLADAHLHVREPRDHGARRVEIVGSDHRDRDHRDTRLQREPGQTRLALVETSVGRAGPLRIHPHQVTLVQLAPGGISAPAAASAPVRSIGI